MKRIPLLIFILSTAKLLSQNDQNYLNPNSQLLLSPDVSAFQRYNLTDINLYNGKIDLSIPLYEIKTGGIDIPITLTYNSGGIRVDNISSSVGMGWNLNAGGNIIRQMKDLDDHDLTLGPGLPGPTNKPYISKKGWFMEFTDISSVGNTNGLNLSYSKTDASPDLFTAFAPGLKSNFYLSYLDRGTPNNYHTNVSTYNINFLDGSGAKGLPVTRKPLINNLPAFGFSAGEVLSTYFPSNVGYGGFPMDYEKFELINTQGIKYHFKSPDIIETIPSFASSTIPLIVTPGGYSQQTYVNYQQAKAGGQYSIKNSAWHLDKIEDPATNRNVIFNYQKYAKPDKKMVRGNINTVKLEDAMPFLGGAYNYSRTNMCSYGLIADYIPYPVSNENPPDECLVKNQFLYTKAPQTNRISSIEWDNGKVDFFYDLTREDELNEKALTKIEVTINNKKLKTFIFNYTYFNSKENCSEWQCKRLKLENIDIINSGETQSKRYYTFEYDYSVPLPKVNSLQQDFLGFYNNHGVELEPINMHIHPQIQKSPNLYYRRDAGKLAIAPFPVLSSPFIVPSMLIPGDYSLGANNYALTGILKKVINPLGGFNEYEYELNDFFETDIFGTIQGGGARIKSQIINDGEKERFIKYEYKLANGRTSGKITGIPVYGAALAYDPKRDNNNVSFVVYTNNKENIELTNNGYIGYTRVIEREEGRGFTEHLFSYGNNEEDVLLPHDPYNYCYNFLYNNSDFKYKHIINNDILRGKILEKNEYNELGNKVKQQKYSYTKTVLNDLPLSYQNTMFQPLGIVNYGSLNSNYIANIARHQFTSNLRSERYLLTEIKETNFLTVGNMESTTNFLYDPIYPFIKTKTVNGSDSTINQISSLYAHDTGNQTMITANMLNIPLVITNNLTKNSTTKEISKVEKIFGKNQDTSNLILPTSVIEYNKDSSQTTAISYDKYDNKGNLLQYTTLNGVPTVYIWGYGQTLPIAKIEGVTYGQLMQKFNLNPNDNQAYLNLEIVQKSNVDLDANSEATLLNSLKSFRSAIDFQNHRTTTYTHNPSIGVTNMILPNNSKESFAYNNEDKLEKIFDNSGKIMKEYFYHRVPNRLQEKFYNRKQEQIFYKTDCPPGYTADGYNYTVPAGKYVSSISLVDANQQALNEIQMNGQNSANALGTCVYTSCPFTPQNTLHSITSAVQKIINTDNVQATINIPAFANPGTDWSGVLIGGIGGSCKLQASQNVLLTIENGRTWRVLMIDSGLLFIQLVNGTVGSTDIINLNFSYNVNDTNTP
ncbi:hypothetical protein ASG22_00810 [Chryseobacterium sp. Leaf405]|uniref:DUF5977 domain-containing protein n=1 Tax=Chryseobacterium sp. Leaf405 TaxID=1736367 RepID=UPI0006FC4323|nr:DUF5977 domain-containing protein [Chryseobacterium sp. Leaf405]KQT35598.1 hypothetical protein ASG22_00810 [Chryseobacterium sp. Leaf405]